MAVRSTQNTQDSTEGLTNFACSRMQWSGGQCLVADPASLSRLQALETYFGGTNEHSIIVRLLTFVILFNNLIPISLYVPSLALDGSASGLLKCGPKSISRSWFEVCVSRIMSMPSTHRKQCGGR